MQQGLHERDAARIFLARSVPKYNCRGGNASAGCGIGRDCNGFAVQRRRSNRPGNSQAKGPIPLVNSEEPPG